MPRKAKNLPATLRGTNIIGIVRSPHFDYRYGSVMKEDFSDPRWDYTSGGTMTSSARRIYGYVTCDKIDGEISHSCRHGPPPHRIKVCVVKKHTDPNVFASLEKLANK